MKPLSVYVHLPFCEKRCGYCDFVSCCDLQNIDMYLERLCAEIKAFDFTAYEVRTIYLGGGTPSILTPEQFQKLADVLPHCTGEFTIECNPNSLTDAKCGAYRVAGVNRVSIGVQSFDDVTLRSLGRLHDVKQAVAAIRTAKKYFMNVSIDLIKDIPQHRLVMPSQDVLDLIQHISVYSLIRNDKPVLETDERVVLPRDFVRYEVSNYARPGNESQHNLVYWHGGEYIGFGAGAHSLLNNTRFCNSSDIMHYTRQPGQTRTPEQIHDEQIMLGLRVATGVPQSLLTAKADVVADLVARGLVKIKNDHVVATSKGLRLLNQIWLRLV